MKKFYIFMARNFKECSLKKIIICKKLKLMKLLKPVALLLLCTAPFFALNAHAGKNKAPKEGKKVPIDGGISALLIAGTAFGIKALVDKNKKSKEENKA